MLQPAYAAAPPQIGSPAPDFQACATGSRVARVSDYWRERPLALIFLRYLGCPFCRMQVSALRDSYPRFQELGAEVVCVAMGGEKVGRAFQLMFALPYPLLMLDESDTRPYRAYGLQRGSLRQLFGPRMLAAGAAALLALGRRAGGLSGPGDKLQMPGAFVIDTEGTIRLAYRGRNSADNAPISLLLEAVEQIAGAPV